MHCILHTRVCTNKAGIAPGVLHYCAFVVHVYSSIDVLCLPSHREMLEILVRRERMERKEKKESLETRCNNIYV